MKSRRQEHQARHRERQAAKRKGKQDHDRSSQSFGQFSGNNLFCPFCSYPMTGHQLPLADGTICPHCSAAVKTQDISPYFGAFDRLQALAGIVTPTDVRLEPPTQSPPRSWRERLNVRDHFLYAVLLAVLPGCGWVAAGWKVTGSIVGALGAVAANYLTLRLSHAVSVWIARRHHGPERLAELARLALPARTPPAPKEASISEYLANFACAAVTLLVIGGLGPLIGSLVGIAIMWPLAVLSRAEKVQGTHAAACYALYFLAGVSSVPNN